jgi:hypothetical protein
VKKLVLLFGAIIAVGGLVLGIGLLTYYENGEVWKTTTGTITGSDIREVWVGGLPCCGGFGIYFPNVTYEFHVDGVDYTGNTVSASSSPSRDVTFAQRVLDDFPLGETVTVYYSPSDHSNCFLRIEESLDYVPMIIGIALTSIGVGGIFLTLRSKESRSKK